MIIINNNNAEKAGKEVQRNKTQSCTLNIKAQIESKWMDKDTQTGGKGGVLAHYTNMSESCVNPSSALRRVGSSCPHLSTHLGLAPIQVLSEDWQILSVLERFVGSKGGYCLGIRAPGQSQGCRRIQAMFAELIQSTEY